MKKDFGSYQKIIDSLNELKKEFGWKDLMFAILKWQKEFIVKSNYKLEQKQKSNNT